ncbi:MAG TPA: geranylgeranylglycerol-phosphate geranylgeranyltransferase [Thermoplasmata archaeon]|nr:geranylgeranylglycerol-phosphate geranylgeranyltransferase [Thermoplasmata archaeon]
MHPALRLVRVGNLGVSFAGTIVGGLVAKGSGVGMPSGFWIAVVLAAISTSLVTAGGNVLNDLLDQESDRTNHPDRPLVTGEFSVGGARFLATALFGSGAVVVVPVILIEPLVGVLLVVAGGALIGYEFRLKSRGFIGNLVVGFLTGLVFLYGGAAAGDALVLVPFAAMAFFATLSREVIKDMEDVAGDVGRSTLPKTHGMGLSGGVAQAAVGIAIALSAVPFLWFLRWGSVVGIIYLVLVLAADGVFVASVANLPKRLHWDQTMSKVGMTIALFAFLAVAFR